MIIWTSAEKIVLPIALLIILTLTVIVTLLLRKKSDKLKIMPFVIIAVILLVLEVVKLVLQIGDYSMWSIPLHFCSTFMIWFSIASFAKGRWQQIGFSISFATGMLFFLMFYIEPSSIIGNSSANIFASFGAFHTFIYHHFVILFIFLAVSLKLYKPVLKDLPAVALLFTIYSSFAILFAHLLGVNFTNLLYNTIPFMQTLLDKSGYVVYTTVMYLFGTLSLLAIITLSYYMKKLITKISTKQMVATNANK